MAMKDYYATLGISRNETPAGIRAAYREAARRTHPDHAGPQGAAAFQDVVEAHAVLSDPDRRREYNASLASHEPNRPRGGAPENPMGNFNRWGGPRAERPEALSVEVILTPEEAARGGVLSIGIPVQEVCAICEGTGRDWLFLCRRCLGNGTLARLQPIQVPIPSPITLGAMSEILLRPIGINNIFLNLRMRVSRDPALSI